MDNGSIFPCHCVALLPKRGRRRVGHPRERLCAAKSVGGADRQIRPLIFNPERRWGAALRR